MSKNVEMRYTGIVGLVPQRSGSSFRVVAQNAQGNHHHPHIAWIAFEEKHVKVPRGWKVLAKDPSKGLVAYALDGWDVEFDNTIESGALQVNADFDRFVLELSDGCHPVYSQSHRIDSLYLRVDDPKLVSARFRIAAGQLGAGYVDPDVEWRWTSWNARWRFVAQEVVNKFVIGEERLVLGCIGGKNCPEVTVGSDSSDPIRVLVGNTLESDIFPKPMKPPTEDEHVRLYYDLAAIPYPDAYRSSMTRRPAHRKLIHPPTSLVKKSIFRRPNGSNCPPGRWTE